MRSVSTMSMPWPMMGMRDKVKGKREKAKVVRGLPRLTVCPELPVGRLKALYETRFVRQRRCLQVLPYMRTQIGKAIQITCESDGFRNVFVFAVRDQLRV